MTVNGSYFITMYIGTNYMEKEMRKEERKKLNS